jgi:hypothetical protein
MSESPVERGDERFWMAVFQTEIALMGELPD